MLYYYPMMYYNCSLQLRDRMTKAFKWSASAMASNWITDETRSSCRTHSRCCRYTSVRTAQKHFRNSKKNSDKLWQNVCCQTGHDSI